MQSSAASEVRNHLPATALATLGLFGCAFGIPAAFNTAGFPQPVQSALPDAPVAVLVLFIVFLGPLLEELIFRKWVISGLQKLRIPFLTAALLSTALWVVTHLPGNIQAGLILVSTGLILCFLRFRTNRVWTCVVAHMIYNTPAAILLQQQ